MLDFVTDLRLEDTVNLKLERKPRERNTNVELLGYSMVDAGNDLGQELSTVRNECHRHGQ